MEGRDNGADFLRLDDADADVAAVRTTHDTADPFGAQLSIPHMPIIADRSALRKLTMAEVRIRRWPRPHIPAHYFRVMDPQADIVVGPCGHFFEAVDYEMASVAQGQRPFSRQALSAGDTAAVL